MNGWGESPRCKIRSVRDRVGKKLRRQNDESTNPRVGKVHVIFPGDLLGKRSGARGGADTTGGNAPEKRTGVSRGYSNAGYEVGIRAEKNDKVLIFDKVARGKVMVRKVKTVF